MTQELDVASLKDQIGELGNIAREMGHEELSHREKLLIKRLKMVILNLHGIHTAEVLKRNEAFKKPVETMTPKPN